MPKHRFLSENEKLVNTFKQYNISRYSLHFVDNLMEKKFRQEYLQNDKIKTFIAFLFGVIPTLIFILNDIRFYGFSQKTYELLIIRSIFLLIAAIVIYTVFKTDNENTVDYMNLTGAFVGMVYPLYVSLLRPKNFSMDVLIEILFLIVNFVILPNRFFFQLFIGTSMAAGIILKLFFYKELEPTAETAIFVVVILSYGIGLFFSRHFHFEHRTLFSFLQRERALINEIKDMSIRDSLTGLANRKGFNDFIAEALQRSYRLNRPGHLLYLDLDDFKAVNDSRGHHCGDSVLQEVAARIRSCLRVVDFAARIGGDEFVVVLEALNSENHPHRVAERLLASISEEYLCDGQSVAIGVSIGIAYFGPKPTDLTTILRKADTAMYRSKKQGKGQISTFDPEKDGRLS